ncbi:MAG TPA: hypothetical protein VFJ97_13850 [Dermatophilaceae bacterium]|nr:hypothetical protein [Dermatophilaceae bacterium]
MTLRTRLTGLLAALGILAIIVGLPAALIAVGAHPIPDTIPSLVQIRTALTSPDDGTLALSAVEVIAWAAWLFLTGSIALEILARVRGFKAPPLPGLRMPQAAARGLVGAAILLFAAGPISGTANASTVAAAQSGASVTAQQTGRAPDTRMPRTSAADPWPTSTVTVHRGDTLSEFALDKLGKADRYPEIFEASRDTVQPDGRHLRDPDLILPGWKLTIPAPGRATGHPPMPATRRRPAVPHAPGRPGATDPGSVPGRGPTPPAAAPGAQDPARPGSTGGVAPSPAAAACAAPPPTAATANQGGVRDHPPTQPPWMLAGLTGGGAMLAGAMLLVLRSRRRAQFRARRPGRTIATPDAVLVPVENTLSAVGGPARADVELMHEVLRRLAAATAHHMRSMPELVAVELAEHTLTLHLSAPAALGQPWQGSGDQLHWALPAAADLLCVGPVVHDQPAPYPLLVTIGTSDHGNVWLLNIEDMVLSIVGDPTFGRDFARYLVAEIACNPWSNGVRVDLIGVAEEVAPMNTDRIRVQTGHTAGADPAAEALADAITMTDRSTEAGVDVNTARARQTGADPWPARLVLIDHTAAGTKTTAPAMSTDLTPALTELLEAVCGHAGQTGTSVVILGERDGTPGTMLRVTADGRVNLPHAGLDLVAVGLTSDEARGCAALLTQSDDLVDAPMPADEHAQDGWRAWSDQAGALREEHTLARYSPSHGEPAVSVLVHEDEDYLRAGATTTRDLDTLAPKVPERVRAAVTDGDPTLDEDVALWWAQDCPLPRLTLLGPVGARTRGTPVTKRKPYYTELLAFLATRSHGATPEELAEAFTITPAKARDYIRILRDWLGTNPRTGALHLPDARQAPAARDRGVGVYQILDLLVDADLFRRLRLRGQSRGPDGVDDLRAALRLVQGRPFDRLRDGGWHWLCVGDRLDQHMTCAVVDVAHLVTTHSLRAGDTRLARLAAETAALAAPDEEIPRLDLAAVADAEGHHGEAERILRDDVCNRTDDDGAPPELSDRTREVIASRHWQDRTRQAG